MLARSNLRKLSSRATHRLHAEMARKSKYTRKWIRDATGDPQLSVTAKFEVLDLGNSLHEELHWQKRRE